MENLHPMLADFDAISKTTLFIKINHNSQTVHKLFASQVISNQHGRYSMGSFVLSTSTRSSQVLILSNQSIIMLQYLS